MNAKISKDPFSEELLSSIFKTAPDNPTRLIKREDKCHEFKVAYSNGNMVAYLKTMAAFANHDGGYIIFGVNDSPRELVGLHGKALQQFNELPVEKLTELVNDYFSPAIDWKNCVFQFRGNSYGVIYVFPLDNKPTICKKTKDMQNNKYSLKEADIYYRYAGRSERIKYPELVRIIDEKRKSEEKNWLRFLLKAAKVGVENASIIDLSKGEILEGGNRIILDEPLLKKIRFIKEGQFVEKEGAPALRLMGDITAVESGKVVYSATKKVIKAIEQTEIIEAFLKQEKVENPVDYIKRICSSSTGNLPVYYYIKIADLSQTKVLDIVNKTTARGTAKKVLIERLKDYTPNKTKSFPQKETDASKKRKHFISLWESHSISSELSDEELKSCISSILYMQAQLVLTHIGYIKTKMFELYKKYYEASSSTIANEFRNSICYIDSVEFFRAAS